MKLENIKAKHLIALIPEKVSLIYVHYNESLDEHEKLLQNIITSGNWDDINENIDEWFRECRWESIATIKKQLREELETMYGFDEDDCQSLIDLYEDEIEETIYDRDDSDPFKDLLDNTSNIIAHYDTGYSMDSESWNWSDAEVRLERIKIKKFLSIKKSDYDDNIDMMIMQATYGGNLLIYFEMDFDNFLNQDFDKIKSIEFTDAHIGIIDHCNGSGDITELPKHSFKIPFDRENMFLEQSIKYNWTYSIAGMCRDWCESTSLKYLEEDLGKADKSPTIELQKKEDYYNKMFKSGVCTFGDMDIKRHRNAVYVNNYPCGNKCTDCGTFWID